MNEMTTPTDLAQALRELTDACEAEYCSADTDGEGDDSKVAFPEESCSITFGMIRRARAALAAHESRAQPAVTVTDEMVQRFLGWRLPDDFAPDSGVSFNPIPNPLCWPTGTNILNDPQARAMLEHVLAVAPPPAQPASVADGYKQIGWVHPVYLDQHVSIGTLAIEVSRPRLSDAQLPVFIRAAAPQPPAKESE